MHKPSIEPVLASELEEESVGRRVLPSVQEVDDADPTDADGSPIFCSLTFGQFFTMLVLLVVTVCGAFYVGARYGNRYLRLDQLDSASTDSERDDTVAELPSARPAADDAFLRARAALQAQQQQKLEAQVKQYLQNPASAPLGDAPPLAQALAPQAAPQAPRAAPIGTASVVGPETDGAANPLVQAARDSGPVDSAPYVPTAARSVQPQVTQPELVNAAGPGEHVVGVNAAQPALQLQGASGLPYAVQVAAYRDIREAQAKVNEWQSKGYSAYVTEAQLGDKGKWYRVRLGAFATRQEATGYLSDLQQKETIDAMIVGQ